MKNIEIEHGPHPEIEISELINHFQADKEALLRKYTNDFSEEYFNRFYTFYDSWEDNIAEINYSELSDEGKIDYLLLKNHVEKERYFIDQSFVEFKAVKFTLDFADPLNDFIVEARKGLKPDAPKLAKIFNTVIKEILEKKEKLKPFKSLKEAKNAARSVHNLSLQLTKAHSFYYGYDPDFTWWLEKSFTTLKNTLKAYEEFLHQNYSLITSKDNDSGIVGKPIGREDIIKRLRLELIPYLPEELIESAEEQFKWCEQEMLKASNELGFGNDWHAALEFVKDQHVPPGHQPELINFLAEEAIRFLEDNDLLTIPYLVKETWRIEMMSPERQKINPFFFGGELLSISFPTNTMDHDDKMMSMRGNNKHFARATVHHELVPGHHIQEFMNARYKKYRNIFSTPFWIEGWALYWEINLWDKGFPNSPEDRIGMLFWRMHRCARIIFSLKYHLNKMTSQQCIDFLVDKVGHEYANAEAEIRRSFTGDDEPLYQLAYMIGGLQFLALRNELIDSGKYSEKEFNDSVLKEGDIPVAFLRAILKKESLPKKYNADWRFLDAI